MQLPASIQTYFTAQPPQDGVAFAAAFTDGAVVHDEGNQHRGPEEIRRWWLASKAKYRHHAEPLSLREADGEAVVQARVTGDFPGSPAVLTFTFALEGGRIAALKIG
ncbi:nuclear transport factor 2 family protein [Pararhodobacter zhoushanensis]|uniref:nuclear transport factor 2 family protein n=1 Tax=Pararhodobacter zhoushanensis TaxID=2479545 RepID=UPI000F8C3E3F|nr:nuclear transport factor 2 family protein [Pararhodobacter zhoushanensis]